MAKGTGVSLGTLSQIERGHNTTLHVLILACRYLDLEIALNVNLDSE